MGVIYYIFKKCIVEEGKRFVNNNNYQNGEVQVNHNRFLGYTKDEDGHLIIEPTEAEVVKRI